MGKIYKNTSGVVNYIKYLYKKDRFAKEEIKNMMEQTNNNISIENDFQEIIKSYSKKNRRI